MKSQNPYKQKRRQNRHRMSRKARLAAQALYRQARFMPPPLNRPALRWPWRDARGT